MVNCPNGHTLAVADPVLQTCSTCGAQFRSCPLGHPAAPEAKVCPTCGIALVGDVPKPVTHPPRREPEQPSAGRRVPPLSPAAEEPSSGSPDPIAPRPTRPRDSTTAWKENSLSEFAAPNTNEAPARPTESPGRTASLLTSQKGRGTKWIVSSAVAVVVAVLAVVVVLATSRPHSTPDSVNAGTAPPPTEGGPSPPSVSSGGTTPPTAPPISTTPTIPASEAPVNVAAVAWNSQSYGGINQKNFSQAYAAYSPGYQQNVGESALATGDATTTDSNVNIVSMTQNADGSWTVDVTFSSQQAAANGPNGETCTNWWLAYDMVQGSGAEAPSGTPLSFYIASAAPYGPGMVGC
jgi:hypothetical protein